MDTLTLCYAYQNALTTDAVYSDHLNTIKLEGNDTQMRRRLDALISNKSKLYTL